MRQNTQQVCELLPNTFLEACRRNMPIRLSDRLRLRMSEPSVGMRLARGAFWSLISMVVVRFLGLAAAILVARLVGKTGFGEFGTIQSSIFMFGTFSGLGLGVTATKYVAELREKDAVRTGRIIALTGTLVWGTGLAVSCTLALLAPWLAIHVLASPHMAGMLQIAAIGLLAMTVNGAQIGVLTGLESFKTMAWVNCVSGVVSLPLMILLTWRLGVAGAMWGFAATQWLTWALFHFGLRAECKKHAIPFILDRTVRQEIPILWRYSIPAMIGGIIGGVATWAASAMLVNQPDGYAKMGAFTAANHWFTILLFLPGILGQVALPMLSERVGQDNLPQARKLLLTLVAINGGIVIPVAAIGALLSRHILLLYGPTYSDHWPTLALVFATVAIYSIQSTVWQLLTASGRMWTGLLMNLGWAIIFLGLTWLWIAQGDLGLAAARLAAYAAHSVWTLWFAYWFLGRKQRDHCS